MQENINSTGKRAPYAHYFSLVKQNFGSISMSTDEDGKVAIY